MKWGRRKQRVKKPKRTVKQVAYDAYIKKPAYTRKGKVKSTKRIITETAIKTGLSAGTIALGVKNVEAIAGKKIAAIYGAVGAGITLGNAAMGVLSAKERAKGKFKDEVKK